MLRKIFGCTFLLTGSLSALPTEGELIQGQASLSPSTDSLRISANGKAIFHWKDFSIASHEAVHFFQAEGNQAILNRVTTSSVSEILGLLQANCPIYLINPNGIYIGNSAAIETAGFTAATADLSNEAFLQGKELLFQELRDGRIVNLGKISVGEGDVVLIARGIENRGQIAAPNGMAILATREVMLYPDSKQCLFIRTETAPEEEGIQNSGSIQALAVELNTCSPYEKAIQHTGSIEAFATVEQNGRIYLVAETGGAVVAGALLAESGEIRVLGQTVALESKTEIDASGGVGGKVLVGGDYKGSNSSVQNAKSSHVADGAKISADGWDGDAGKIVIWADDHTECTGTISAAAFGERGDGGFVEISGKRTLTTTSVPNLRSKSGKAGTLLLDPGTITISSGAAIGPNTYGSTFINTSLASGNVILDTSTEPGGGAQTLTVDSTVTGASAITWNTANTLTLNAGQGVIIQSGATIQATGAGNLTINGNNSVAGATYQGISITGATLTVTSGALQLTGTGGDTLTPNDGIAISGATTISATTGSVTLQGNGGNSSNGITKTGGSVTTSGGGPLNMTGTAGAGGTGIGISLTGGAVSTTNNGNISLTGNGAGTGNGSDGLTISTNVTVGGTGTLTINGTASAAAASSNGITITAGTISTASGLMTLMAQGGGTGSSNIGISLTSTITTINGGINIQATGSIGAVAVASATGLLMNNGRIQATGSGAITINATGATMSTAGGHAGFSIPNGNSGTVTTASGVLTITALGGAASTGDSNYGIFVNTANLNTLISSGSDLNITATAASIGGSNNVGLSLTHSGANSGQYLAAGNLTINATGAVAGTGTGNIGFTNFASIMKTTGTGLLQITAIGNQNGPGASATGLLIDNGVIQATGSGAMTINATGAAMSIAGGHAGFSMSSGTITTASGVLTITALGGAASTGDSNYGIFVNTANLNTLISSGSDLNITATAASIGGSNNVGLSLTHTGTNSGQYLAAGNLTVNAIGAVAGTGIGNIGFAHFASVMKTTGTGLLQITAIGNQNGPGASATGLLIDNGVIQATGSGAMTINATGAAMSTAGGHAGFSMPNGSTHGGTVTTASGVLTITALGGAASTGDSNYGIFVNASNITAQISSGSDLNITAIAASIGGSNNVGLSLSHAGSGTGQYLAAGNLTINATGAVAGTGIGNVGFVNSVSIIRTTGTGLLQITAIGNQNGTGGSAIGLSSNGTIQSTGGGNISISGTGSGSSASSCIGTQVSGGTITTAGVTTINGTGAANVVGNTNIGVSVTAGSISSTGSLAADSITIAGVSGGQGTGNQGVSLAGGTVTSTNGNISVTGTGGTISGNTNQGIILSGATASITSTNGNISLTGNGGFASNGIHISAGTVSTSGTGTITALGTGGSGTGGYGIFLTGASSLIQTTAGGGISLTGNGAGTGVNAEGIGVLSAAKIQATGTGEVTLTGTASPTGGNFSRGIVVNGTSSIISSNSGTIMLSGTGGGTAANSRGIEVSTSGQIISTSGLITGTFIGAAGTGSCYGVFLSGGGALIQTAAGGAISLTGNGAGTGINAEGIGVLNSAKIQATGTGAVTLIGTASSTGGNFSRGIVVNGTSSTLSSNSGTIMLSGTGGGTGANSSGMEVSTGGQIISTSGLITGTCIGAAGTNGCNGIYVSNTLALITAATGSGINLTGTGGGTTTSNQGISISGGGAITTTNNAPITLTGTGSSLGTGSNEGIFMTGASTKVGTATGAIQMTGVAGGGTTNGITVDTSASVFSSTAGLVTLTSTNNNVAVQNNSSVKTQGVGGPGINDISITSKGLSVTGGAAGSAVVSTVNGNVTVASTGPVSVIGAAAVNSFGQITVGNSANTVGIQMTGLTLTGGSGSGAFAEISTVGGLLSIDSINGTGAIALIGGSNANTQAQIITKTNAVVGDTINIGKGVMPTTITLQGGSGGTLSRAVIASDAGGNIVCNASGNYSITGGTSANDSRAGFYAGLTSGTGDISLTGAAYSLTGGASGAGYNSAEILAPAAGGMISLTSNGSAVSLQGGGAATSDARIESQGSGNLSISTIGAFTASGGSGATSRAIVATGQGGNITVTGSGDYTITGGSSGADSRAGIFSGLTSGNGDISVSGGAMSITGGSGTGTGIAGIFSGIASGSGNILVTGTSLSLTGGSNTGTNLAQIAAPAGGGSVAISATGAVSLTGGTAANQFSSIETAGNSGANPISVSCGSLALNGSTTVGASNAAAEIQTVQGNIGITASGDITLAGGEDAATNALIQCTTQGAITVSSVNATIQGGVGAGTSGIVTQAGDISITCSQDLQCSAPNAGAIAAIQTFGSNLTATVNGSIALSGFTLISTPAPTGDILMIAGKNISIGTSVQIINNGAANSSLKLVVDNNYPVSPQIGPGQFTLDAGATISAAGSPPVKIYTSRRSQNTINSPINGEVFVPGPFGVDTPTEQWNTYYPTDPPAPAFTIYYKEPQSITPVTPVIYNNIGVNLIQLARVLPILKPVLNMIRGHYHFQLCDEANGLPCDPTFSPYGSFIFEDDVYWIGVGFLM